MVSRLIQRLSRLGTRLGFHKDWYLIGLAAAIGVITAFGAILFVELLRMAEHGAMDLNRMLLLRPVPWLLPALPMLGALLTGILVHRFAREAKGHGVPEVMDSIFRKKARIRPRVAIVKSIASVLTIGSGGSAGAEGPIVQIGSALGSGVSQILGVTRDQAATLLGCGAAAGISSVFNAPIAGVFFVLEILLRDFSLRTFTPIVVASVFSAATTQAYYGENDAIFAVQGELASYKFTFPELPSYLILGLVCGFVAVGFIRALYYAEDLYDKLKWHPIVKPVSGAFLLGLLGIAYVAITSWNAEGSIIPPFFGNGYDTIRALLNPMSYAEGAVTPVTELEAVTSPFSAKAEPFASEQVLGLSVGALLLLLICKSVATCFTLGSGGSGGVFAPSLFLGATTGALFGELLAEIGLLPQGGSPAAYALVGMAALVAGTTHAPLTAILILFELTRDVYVLLPIMLAAVLSVVAAQFFLRDSIYTFKLRRRGVLVGSAADLTLLRRLTARDVTPTPHIAVHPDDALSRLLELRDLYKTVDFVVVDHENRYLGLVTGQDMRTALIEREAIPYLLVEDLLRRDLPAIHPDDTLDTVLEKFSRHDVSSLPLLEGGRKDRRVAGLITRARLMRRYQQALTES